MLRARVGQEFDIVCGGQLRRGTVVSVSAQRVEFALGEAIPPQLADGAPDLPGFGRLGMNSGRTGDREGPGERELVLLMAIYKFDRLEWAIEKCTELGATRIVPVMARRTDAHLAAAAAKRVERWRRIAHEAAQQSRRLTTPCIDEPMTLKSAMGIQAPTRLLLNENERGLTFREALSEASGALAFAVGPEGGWTEEELAEFDAAGWRSVTLGSTILRAETAAIAALAAARAILE